jgi:hypothetical protein
MQRDFKLAITLPLDDMIAEWRWSNWCGPHAQIQLWGVQVGPGPSVSAQHSLDLFPACLDASAPTTLRLERAINGFDGDLSPIDSCAGELPGWACEFAERVTIRVAHGELNRVLDGYGGYGETMYQCGPGGSVVGFDYSDLCAASQPGDSVPGFPLTLHGSEGGPVSSNELLARLAPLLDPVSGATAVPRLAAAGCQTSGDCSTFILAWATNQQPAVAYLVFQLRAGYEPTVIGAGLSGDNADTILNGGETTTMLGATTFAPFPAPE